MNTNYHRNEQTRLMGEAQAHLDLGLRDEAECQINQYITMFGADVPSLAMKLGMVNARGDYQMAGEAGGVRHGLLIFRVFCTVAEASPGLYLSFCRARCDLRLCDFSPA